MEQKEIIIRLLKDHLIHTKLLKGLENLGLIADDYYLHLSDTIFKMIGIGNEKEELYLAYLDWCTMISHTDIFRDQKLLNSYALAIYDVLLAEAD